MTTWLDAIKQEMERMDEKELEVPFDEINPETDEIICLLDLEYRELFCLGAKYKRAALKVLQTCLLGLLGGGKVAVAAVEGEAHQWKADIINQIFWVSVRDAYQLWDEKVLAIRENWRLVRCKPLPPPDSPFMSFPSGSYTLQ